MKRSRTTRTRTKASRPKTRAPFLAIPHAAHQAAAVALVCAGSAMVIILLATIMIQQELLHQLSQSVVQLESRVTLLSS